jgi:hypothetical protein
MVRPRGFRSSTSQFNLSQFCHWEHPIHPTYPTNSAHTKPKSEAPRLEEGDKDDGEFLHERHGEERRHVVVQQVGQDDDVQKVVGPPVVVRHQAVVVDAPDV